MKIIRMADIEDSQREVHCPQGGFVSFRYLLARDGMGFSMHKTVIPAGPAQRWHYTSHMEACYCIAGYGILTNLATGEQHEIEPDVVYALDSHDDHTFEAIQETILISVFNPPITGSEVHNADGSYSIGDAVHDRR